VSCHLLDKNVLLYELISSQQIDTIVLLKVLTEWVTLGHNHTRRDSKKRSRTKNAEVKNVPGKTVRCACGADLRAQPTADFGLKIFF